MPLAGRRQARSQGAYKSVLHITHAVIRSEEHTAHSSGTLSCCQRPNKPPHQLKQAAPCYGYDGTWLRVALLWLRRHHMHLYEAPAKLETSSTSTARDAAGGLGRPPPPPPLTRWHYPCKVLKHITLTAPGDTAAPPTTPGPKHANRNQTGSQTE